MNVGFKEIIIKNINFVDKFISLKKKNIYVSKP